MTPISHSGIRISGWAKIMDYSFAAKQTATINPMAIAKRPQITLTKMLAIDFI